MSLENKSVEYDESALEGKIVDSNVIDEKKQFVEQDKTTIDDYDSVDYIGDFEERFISRLLYKTGHSADDDQHNLPKDVQFMLNKITKLSVDEAREILVEALEYHNDDPNFPEADAEEIKLLLADEKHDDPEWNFELKMLASLILYHSPYPEVRSVTDPFDDTTVAVETIRSYTLLFIWVIIGSGVNEFFSHRKPSISLSSPVIQMLLYPCGKAWEAAVPDWGFNFRGKRISLNPGPWTFKEQMFATICYSVTSAGVYVSSNIIVQKLFYKNDWLDFGFQVLLALSTQFLGFGFAGILRKFCIYPVRSIWPSVLPTLALNQALLKAEQRENIHGWTITRYKFFWISAGLMFLYFWIPDYLFQALSTFNWMTWIAPNNFNLAVVTGSVTGLGFNPIATFDWNVANYLSPLTNPWFSTMNQFIGIMISFFTILGVYYSNYYWSAYLTINDNGIYTNTGESYDVSQVLTNSLLDLEKYKNYSPPLYTAANLVTYGAFFAIYPFSFVYTFFIERKTVLMSLKLVYKGFKNLRGSNFEGLKDPHSRMMSKYKEVPDWYFLVILVISLVLAILCVELYPTNTPVWGIFFLVGMNFVFLIPLTLVYSVTGFSFGLNVLVELIVGYALPGNGVALMTLKALGYNIDGQADSFVADQKLLHYAKIPPMAIFRGQLLSAFIQVFVVLGVVNWQISNVEDFCSPTQSQKFSCPGERTYYSASVFWGVIGPKRVFNQIYPLLKWCFLIGFLLSLFFVALKVFFPKLMTNKIQPTVILGGFINVFAPYNLSYVFPSMYFAFAFMYYIRRHYLAWFEKYNYVLVSSWQAGVAFSAVIIFFAVQYHDKSINWWGNNVMYEGVDGGVGRVSLKDPSTVKFFGPSTWS